MWNIAKEQRLFKVDIAQVDTECFTGAQAEAVEPAEDVSGCERIGEEVTWHYEMKRRMK
jgi:hypothetical protein